MAFQTEASKLRILDIMDIRGYVGAPSDISTNKHTLDINIRDLEPVGFSHELEQTSREKKQKSANAKAVLLHAVCLCVSPAYLGRESIN